MLHIGVELGRDVTAIYLEMVCASSQAEMALASSNVMVLVCTHIFAGHGGSHDLRSGDNPRELVSSRAAASRKMDVTETLVRKQIQEKSEG